MGGTDPDSDDLAGLGLCGLFECLFGDHDLLDLAGAFVDAEQAGVAVEALDGDAAHVADAAVDLEARSATRPTASDAKYLAHEDLIRVSVPASNAAAAERTRARAAYKT